MTKFTDYKTWGDFDKERQRKVENIMTMARKLDKARDNLDEWSMQVVDYLITTIGKRK